MEDGSLICSTLTFTKSFEYAAATNAYQCFTWNFLSWSQAGFSWMHLWTNASWTLSNCSWASNSSSSLISPVSITRVALAMTDSDPCLPSSLSSSSMSWIMYSKDASKAINCFSHQSPSEPSTSKDCWSRGVVCSWRPKD